MHNGHFEFGVKSGGVAGELQALALEKKILLTGG
jgi:hypothetical protein